MSSMAPPPPFAQVVDDLIKGQQFAAQLQDLLRASPKAGLIVDQILHTFSRAIHAAEAAAATTAGEWSSDVQSEVTDGGSGGGKRKSAAGGGDRRACRRKTQQSSVVTKTLKSLDDGLSWRKYGQKDIQNCKHPKAYFRCTHKYDQLCAAQRQVQLCEDDSGTFKVTYLGVHTCQDPADVPPNVHHQTAGTSDALQAGFHLISFAPNAVATPASTTSTMTTSTTNYQLTAGPSIGSGPQSLKLEGGDHEEVLSSNTPGCSALRSTGAGAATAPTWPADQGDVTSALQYGGDVHFGDFDDDYSMYLLGDLVPYHY
ncbi:transcription factor WRKY45-1-like [Lolium rigidum]|uniref:transcription factor WRKY45-1-like n=1 Tax=Lolium rigidum TaxID=89674 RepID=UPI001F5D5D5E|nr:transcription factor WRKY45-1-like [Lolium rigidum]